MKPSPRPTDLARESVTRHALAAYKRISRHRSYALNGDVTTTLAALTAALAEANRERGARSFDPAEVTKQVLEPLTKVIPSLTQQRPASESELKLPHDPVTGEAMRNPYSAPKDLTSVALLEKEKPELAAYLKSVANGTTYAHLTKLAEEREAREKVRSLTYGEAEHEANAFVHGGLDEQGQFIRRTPESIVDFYRAEARPVELDLESLTIRGQIAKHAPQLQPIVDRAREIRTAWREDDRATLIAAKEENERELAAMEAPRA